MSIQNPLVEVSEFVRTQAKSSRVAVIFDLDSTLFCVSSRTQNILRRLGSEPAFRAQFAAASDVLMNVEVLPTDWGVKQVLERAKMPVDSAELVRAVRNYWRKHFFSSHDLHHDIIYPSANEYVRHLHKLGADIMYLTGRPEGSMRPGTIKALHAFGFPYTADEKLMMKPSEAQTDEGFKANLLKELVKNYDHIWFFENEPVIIEQVRELLPQVRIVFVDSTHSGKANSPTDLRKIGMSYSGEWD